MDDKNGSGTASSNVEITAGTVDVRFDAVQLRAYIPVLVEHDLLERLRRGVAA